MSMEDPHASYASIPMHYPGQGTLVSDWPPNNMQRGYRQPNHHEMAGKSFFVPGQEGGRTTMLPTVRMSGPSSRPHDRENPNKHNRVHTPGRSNKNRS